MCGVYTLYGLFIPMKQKRIMIDNLACDLWVLVNNAVLFECINLNKKFRVKLESVFYFY